MKILCFIDWINANSALINLMTSLILSTATTIYVVFTIKLVNETRKARIQQLEPHLTLYLDNSETSAGQTYIKVRNLGNGVAFNVKFEIIKDIDYSDSISLSGIPLFKNGIKYFPDKHEFRFFITNLQSNSNEKKRDYIEIKINYNDSLGNFKEDFFHLDLTNTFGDGVITPPDTYIGMISHSLENISKTLKK